MDTNTTISMLMAEEAAILLSVPLSLFVAMCVLAGLGIIYSTSLLVFNIAYQRNKMIKMTSPNINIVILLGAVIGFTTMILLGLDQPLVTSNTMQQLLQSCVFLLPFSFSLIYASLFAKVARVYMIFSNINFNGKASRDEHLLLAVTVTLVLDLVILVPWQVLDPITCKTVILYTIDSNTSTKYETQSCSSSLQWVWILAVYLYKFFILVLGLYVTWGTRKVTLPALRDSRQIYVVVSSVAVLGLTSVAVLVVTQPSPAIKYSVGALTIWFTLTITITLLYIPKVMLLRGELKKNSTDSGTQGALQFNESMARTKKLTSHLITCFRCVKRDAADVDKYGLDVLTTEIETLKHTIKQKDASIRELTDRLYVGAEKFQKYLTSPPRYQTVGFDQPTSSRTQVPLEMPPSRDQVLHELPSSRDQTDLDFPPQNRHAGPPRLAPQTPVQARRSRRRSLAESRHFSPPRDDLRDFRLQRFYDEYCYSGTDGYSSCSYDDEDDLEFNETTPQRAYPYQLSPVRPTLQDNSTGNPTNSVPAVSSGVGVTLVSAVHHPNRLNPSKDSSFREVHLGASSLSVHEDTSSSTPARSKPPRFRSQDGLSREQYPVDCTPSSNEDSAFDNNSPSSAGSSRTEPTNERSELVKMGTPPGTKIQPWISSTLLSHGPTVQSHGPTIESQTEWHPSKTRPSKRRHQALVLDVEAIENEDRFDKDVTRVPPSEYIRTRAPSSEYLTNYNAPAGEQVSTVSNIQRKLLIAQSIQQRTPSSEQLQHYKTPPSKHKRGRTRNLGTELSDEHGDDHDGDDNQGKSNHCPSHDRGVCIVAPSSDYSHNLPADIGLYQTKTIRGMAISQI